MAAPRDVLVTLNSCLPSQAPAVRLTCAGLCTCRPPHPIAARDDQAAWAALRDHREWLAQPGYVRAAADRCQFDIKETVYAAHHPV